MMRLLFVGMSMAVASAAAATAQPGAYNGVKVGDLCAVSECAQQLRGSVYLVNKTHVQIVGLNVVPKGQPDLRFQFSDAADAQDASAWYLWHDSPQGDWLELKTGNLDAGFKDARIVVAVPGGDASKWKNFGVISAADWKYIGAVALNSVAPPAIAVLTDSRGNQARLQGNWYGVAASKIEMLDARTLRLTDFTFLASKPPDGWFFTGNGAQPDKTNGKKCGIVGRDTRSLKCPMRDDIHNQVVTIELPEGQTVYNINYLSVYCYAVGVDFGHMEVAVDPSRTPVPPALPAVRTQAPPADAIGTCA